MYAEELLALFKRIAPDQLMEIGRRAQVLTGIENMQPVGRRALSARLRLSEREVRAVATSLKEQGLLHLDAAGMQLTDKARDVLSGARDLSRAMFGLSDLERMLSQRLNVPHVIVVSGDADEDQQVLRDVGRAAAHRVKQLLQSGMTLAVGGGGTMLELAKGISSSVPLNIMVVPARGGMGSSVESQASVVASELARRVGGHYRVMHLPDSVDEATLKEMCKQKDLRETIELLQRADVVAHGIGRADQMARQRGLSQAESDELLKKGAVGEAFGDFFDESGRTVFQMSTVSVELTKLQKNPVMLAVAAGKRKADAIIACTRHEAHESLITDEGAANEILLKLSALDDQ